MSNRASRTQRQQAHARTHANAPIAATEAYAAAGTVVVAAMCKAPVLSVSATEPPYVALDMGYMLQASCCTQLPQDADFAAQRPSAASHGRLEVHERALQEAFRGHIATLMAPAVTTAIRSKTDTLESVRDTSPPLLFDLLNVPEATSEERTAYLAEATRMAASNLLAAWPAVEHLAQRLMKQGTLHPSDVQGALTGAMYYQS